MTRLRLLPSLSIFFVAALVVSTAGLGTARADVVSPEPTDCVDGSDPVFCHGPPTCRADTCTSDLECAPDHRCEETPLCVVDHGCGGRLGMPIYLHVDGECRVGGTCDPVSGATCTPTRVCRRGTRLDSGAGMDSGRAEDSGAGGMDSGRLDSGGLDSGPGTDSGSPLDAPTGLDTGRDTGPGPMTPAGCCSAAGHQDAPMALVGLVALALILVTRGVSRRH